MTLQKGAARGRRGGEATQGPSPGVFIFLFPLLLCVFVFVFFVFCFLVFFCHGPGPLGVVFVATHVGGNIKLFAWVGSRYQGSSHVIRTF